MLRFLLGFGNDKDSEKHPWIIRRTIVHRFDFKEGTISFKVRVVDLNYGLKTVGRLGIKKAGQPPAQNEREAEEKFGFHLFSNVKIGEQRVRRGSWR